MAAAVLSLLLLGCAGQQQAPPSQPNNTPSGGAEPQAPPAAPANNTTAAENGTNISAAPPEPPALNETPAQPQGRYTCSLTLEPSSIQQGQTTKIGYSVWSEANVKFTYNCGNETAGIATGGLTAGSKLCEFDTPGNIAVRIKADGAVCAEKNLTVLKRAEGTAPKLCWIEEQSIQRRLAPDYYYAATVRYEGFSENDTMTWICDYTTARSVLGGGPFGGMSAQKEIYCDFSQTPGKDYIDVEINGTSCGSMSTR